MTQSSKQTGTAKAPWNPRDFAKQYSAEIENLAMMLFALAPYKVLQILGEGANVTLRELMHDRSIEQMPEKLAQTLAIGDFGAAAFASLLAFGPLKFDALKSNDGKWHPVTKAMVFAAAYLCLTGAYHEGQAHPPRPQAVPAPAAALPTATQR